MHNKHIVTSFLALLCLLPKVFAGSYNPYQEAPPPIQHSLVLNLRQAIALALRRNPDIRSGYIQRIADKYTLATAYWDFEPQYKLNGTANYEQATSGGSFGRTINYNLTPEIDLKTVYGTQFTLTASNPYNYNMGQPYSFNPQYTIKVVQPLLRGFGREVAEAPLNQAIISEKTQMYNFKNTIINTITQVVTDFHQVILDRQTLKIQKIAVKNDLTTIKEFKEEIKAGNKAPASLNDIQTTYYQDQISVVNDANQLAQDKQSFLLLIGLNPTTKLKLFDKLNYRPNKIPTAHYAIQVALKNNVPFQIDLLQLAADRISLITAEDAARWKLDLTGTAVFGGGSGNGPNSGFRSLVNGQNASQAVSLELEVPIDNVSLESGIVSAQTALAQQQITVQFAKYQIETNVLNFIRQLKTDLENIKLAILRRKYAYQSYQVTRKEIAVGRSTTFELTSKSLNLTDAAQAVVSARITYLDTYATFEAELGVTLQYWHLHVVL